MGFKKRLKYRTVETAFIGAGVRRLVRKVVMGALVLGLLLFVSCVLLLGYSIDRMGKMMAARPDADLVAVQRLIADKAIVLTEKQKEAIAPILKELARPGITPEQAASLKDRMWQVFDRAQLKEVKQWKDQRAKEAASLIGAGKSAVSEVLSKYTGVPAEKVDAVLNGLSGWWQLNSPREGSPEKLLQQVEGK